VHLATCRCASLRLAGCGKLAHLAKVNVCRRFGVYCAWALCNRRSFVWIVRVGRQSSKRHLSNVVTQSTRVALNDGCQKAGLEGICAWIYLAPVRFCAGKRRWRWSTSRCSRSVRLLRSEHQTDATHATRCAGRAPRTKTADSEPCFKTPQETEGPANSQKEKSETPGRM